ncbi:MAG: hypothetical protein MI754_18110 [Chromatiales bacterium]|nr:hypothetical protein [Chromatiales bacterium]
MTKRYEPDKQRESTFLLALFVIFIFASPLTFWWANDDHPWFLPYLLWLLIILIGAWLTKRHRHHDV